MILCVALLFIIGSIRAQEDMPPVRVLGAQIVDGTQLEIQVAVPASMSIERADITSDETTLTLTETTDSEVIVERWLLLDAGQSLLNVEGEIREEVRRLLLDDATGAEIGLLYFGTGGETNSVIFPPTAARGTQLEALANYTASADRVGCVADGLAALRTYIEEDTRAAIARRALLITGGDSAGCDTSELVAPIPVDVLLLGASNRTLRMLADDADVVLASLMTFEQTLAQTLARWQTEIITLTTVLDAPLSQGTVTIALADGQTLSQAVAVTGTFVAPPTVTPTLEPSPTASETPTLEPSATATTTDEPVVVVVATAIATDEPTATPTDIADDATATPEATENIEVASDDEVASSAFADDDTNDDDDAANEMLSRDEVFALLALGALVLIVIFLSLSFRMWRRQQIRAASDTYYNEDTKHIVLAQLRDLRKVSVYKIMAPATVLGRGGESTLIIKDEKLSREHVRFTETEDHGLLVTRITQAEVLVNGVAIEKSQRLYVDDVLTLSPTTRLQVERIYDDVP